MQYICKKENLMFFKKSNYKNINAEEAAELIKKDNVLILDVRTSEEYSEGHIQNARLIPVNTLKHKLSQIENYKNSPVLVYCASGGRSVTASKLLDINGYTSIYNLKNGISEWIKSGLQIER